MAAVRATVAQGTIGRCRCHNVRYHTAMKTPHRQVAIFDVDGTIFRSSLLISVVEAMVDTGLFPESVRSEYEQEHAQWLAREGGYDLYINAVIQAFRANIKGVHYGAFADIAKSVVEREGRHTYRYTRALLAELKQKGYFLLAASYSPKTVLDYFCPALGFDKAYGTLYEIGPEDYFTGSLVDEHLTFNKSYIVKRALEKEGLTLEGSVGVGDTESDIAFLELVEKPICFNPNSQLYRHAKLQGWHIVVERKDVIYEL